MTFWPAIRFHAAAGARVALRNSAAGTAVAIFMIGMAPEPRALLQAIAASTAQRGVRPSWLFVLAMFGLLLARQARPQVAAGRTAWVRSLPVSARTQRAAIVAALILAQAPLLLFVTGCVVAVWLSPGRVDVLKVLVAIPATIGMALIGSLDPIVLPHRRWRTASHLPVLIDWRAVSWRAVPAILPAVLPIAFAWFYRTNNPDLSASHAAAAAQVGGTMGVAMALAGLANLLQSRRPPWSWARSLPWSARQRVLHDSVSLTLGVVPVLLATAIMDLQSVARVVLVLPLLVITAVGAMRRAGKRLTGSMAEPCALGIVIAITGANWPWSVMLFAAATPVSLRIASDREQDVQASMWMELHHRNAGDPFSWSGR